MRILVTNDDGIHAPGLRALAEAVEDLGTVHVVAPAVERSAVGHAITLFEPLWIERMHDGDKELGVAVSGTPADCVKLAIQALLPEPPDLVLSGINRGANTGTNVLYSGTVSAATEGTILGIPSIAISIASFEFRDYEPSIWVARELVRDLREHGLPRGTLLNVNMPPLPRGEIRGVRYTRQGRARYVENFIERTDPRNRTYYWMEGEKEDRPEPPGSDETAVAEGFISICPIHYDLTDWAMLRSMEGRFAELGGVPAPDLPPSAP
ncbi:MAG: 5'/3'-nucleotidase SurE [Gemmatimonadetes bacterium]|nr:5'/3'-nucleotidase SurE [Gemmatimonadota bacterium]